IVGERISQLAIDDKGRVWLGTQGAGVLRFNESQVTNKNSINVVRALNKNNGLDDNYIMSVTDVGDHLWIGTWNIGFYKYIKDRGEVIHYDQIEGLKFKMREVPIVEITEVQNGRKLLLGTRGYGFVVANIKGNQLSNPFHFSSNNKSNKLGNDFITDIFAGEQNILICTEGGLDQYDLSNNKITHLTMDNQIPKSIIQAAIVSEDNHFWVSTYDNGIFEIDKTGDKVRFKNYTKDVLGNYSGSAALFVENETILFGGAQGYTQLSVSNKVMNSMPPIPIIVDLKINNKAVSLGEEVNGSTKFEKVISALPKVRLNYKDNSFSLSINAIQTADGQSLKYAYKLEGFHEDWIYASEEEKNVYFSNLPYQNYSFRFKAGNSDGIWSEEILLPISVSPPWYQSNLAYLLYLLCLVGVIYLLILGFLLKEQYDHQINLEKLERTKIEEVNQMKLKFYTSISHELRTPLTMIISPLEQIQSGKSTLDLQQNHQFILKNAKKLLAMVNQLLDFRKHESETEELDLTRQDIIAFLKESFYSFGSLAKDSELSLEFITDVDTLEMTFDENQIDKLINNLVSNALKYTPKGGTIRLMTKFDPNQNQFFFSVSDTGYGIYQEDLQKIFDRFYQGKDHVQSGYGLGLAIVQSIVELHHGKISVESTRGKGTTFKIILPLGLEEISSNVQHPRSDDYEDMDLFANPKVPIDANDEILSNESDGRRKLLIVEDNEEIRSYLKQNFFDQFEILEAGDGAFGLELAMREIPDIIISDIAMPKMDGLELCKEIKTNMATSHIPVILLTARTSVEYKLNGYEFGANAYITKPFNMDILKQRVVNLLAYSDIIKQKYGKPSSKITYVYEPESPAEQSLDEEFMKNLTHIIEENLSEASFTVDDMAKLLLMSRIQIYRKVKALTGQTPNNFLREIRLKRASQLLELTDYSISEITYKVGFNDLKYFREKFKEEFGINPSDFRQANKLANNN
ncbi:MAG TPA: ATP-binding protein, partial [Saprospiraceae bacterium]|nr:ATP-binding protein [Saprospiraceae bacterium]